MGKAARLFNGTAEQTLYGRVTPTLEQRQFLQEHPKRRGSTRRTV